MTRQQAIAEVRALMRANGITTDDLRALMQLQLELDPEKEEAPAVAPAGALTTQP